MMMKIQAANILWNLKELGRGNLMMRHSELSVSGLKRGNPEVGNSKRMTSEGWDLEFIGRSCSIRKSIRGWVRLKYQSSTRSCTTINLVAPRRRSRTPSIVYITKIKKSIMTTTKMSIMQAAKIISTAPGAPPLWGEYLGSRRGGTHACAVPPAI